MIPILYSTSSGAVPATAGVELIPVDYITIAGTLPLVPYTFDDGIMVKTEEELQQMDISSLLLFSSTLSTSIGLETSSLISNQRVQGIYSILKQLSQSTIDGLDTRVRVNNSLITTYTQNAARLDAVSTTYVCTMQQFDADIAAQLDAINQYNSTISSYTGQYDSSVSSVAKENKDFISAATEYSTLYYLYMGYQVQYDDNRSKLTVVNESLAKAVRRKTQSYAALQESTARWLETSGNLSSLYTERTRIHARLARYRLDESAAYMNYISSIAGFETASTMYSAAVTNEKYALALLRSTEKDAEYAAAVERLRIAKERYDQSVPQGGGGASGASGSILGNSALWAARTMAYQQLQAIEADKIAAENAATTLLNRTDMELTRSYKALIDSYDLRISAHQKEEKTYRDFSLSSLQNVVFFSSMYEQSGQDIRLYTGEIEKYSSLYTSSMDIAEKLAKESKIELSTILGDILTYNAVSWGIRSLNDNYTIVMSNYDTSMKASTLFAGQYYSTMSNIIWYRGLYTRAQTEVNRLDREFYGIGGLINLYNMTLFTNSSILNKEIIAGKTYDANIKRYVNLQDESMYQYRESYCRTQRDVYQVNYESNVFVAVMRAEEINTSNQAAVAAGTTVTPVAADLTTAVVSNSYSKLNSMAMFLTEFDTLYTTFYAQDTTINKLSTSIGKEASAWSTVDFYTTAKYFNTPMISSIDTLVTQSCRAFAAVQDSTVALLDACSTGQVQIDSKKVFILSSLTTFFTQAEILAQETRISSFLIQSIMDARVVLQSQGITVNV